ncbi:MAG TPA: phage portal protein [Sphingomonadaceae bacterium]|nr:phage portal protein [Sphingomonadaceae bacterium]
MRWFGRKAARETAPPFLLRGLPGSVARLGEAPRSYEAQVREGYGANPVAQRAVRLVAEGVGSAVVFDVGENNALQNPSTIPLARNGPPPRESAGRTGKLVTPALLETVATQVMLHGNAFVQVLADERDEAAELFALRPERVSVEADAGGWPVAYRYRVGEARSRIAARDHRGRRQVVHVRGVNPLDDHYGLGCLGAAAGAVALHNQATRWNKALLDNAARPSGALVYEPADGASLSPDQYARLQAQMEAGFAGAGNAGRPMLLEGGLRWQAMSLTPADMDFVGLKAAAAREIALAFGVPPMLLGLPGDAAYANYREANKALWRLTILPLAGKILDALSAALGDWSPGVRLAVDVDQITALSEDRERLWNAVSGADFLTREEKREMLGFGADRPLSPLAVGESPSPSRGEGYD